VRRREQRVACAVRGWAWRRSDGASKAGAGMSNAWVIARATIGRGLGSRRACRSPSRTPIATSANTGRKQRQEGEGDERFHAASTRKAAKGSASGALQAVDRWLAHRLGRDLGHPRLKRGQPRPHFGTDAPLGQRRLELAAGFPAGDLGYGLRYRRVPSGWGLRSARLTSASPKKVQSFSAAQPNDERSAAAALIDRALRARQDGDEHTRIAGADDQQPSLACHAPGAVAASRFGARSRRTPHRRHCTRRRTARRGWWCRGSSTSSCSSISSAMRASADLDIGGGAHGERGGRLPVAPAQRDRAADRVVAPREHLAGLARLAPEHGVAVECDGQDIGIDHPLALGQHGAQARGSGGDARRGRGWRCDHARSGCRHRPAAPVPPASSASARAAGARCAGAACKAVAARTRRR
jgi:hypothetical protein